MKNVHCNEEPHELTYGEWEKTYYKFNWSWLIIDEVKDTRECIEKWDNTSSSLNTRNTNQKYIRQAKETRTE